MPENIKLLALNCLFSNKKIGSGLGRTAEELADSCFGAEIRNGKVYAIRQLLRAEEEKAEETILPQE